MALKYQKEFGKIILRFGKNYKIETKAIRNNERRTFVYKRKILENITKTEFPFQYSLIVITFTQAPSLYTNT